MYIIIITNMIIRINEGTPAERVIGELYEKEGIFFKKVSKSKHLFRLKNAYGIDAKFFTDVLLPNNHFIQIYDNETKNYYGCDAKVFKEFGFYYHFNKEENHHAQIFLSLNHFQVIK